MYNDCKKMIKLLSELLYVYSVQCRYCNNIFEYTVETADTDMLSCYCGSVYSPSDKQLVIAPLTTEEIYSGQSGRLDKRINTISPGHGYKFCSAGVCPFCGGLDIQSPQKRQSIKDYIKFHPNTLVIYIDGTIRLLKEELEALEASQK
ncbi:MAG: hypothetical protein HDT42_09670 [Ruminococcaceae bacterium]|nr:hypothetical protein [Oscillospiraceae bacterium]